MGRKVVGKKLSKAVTYSPDEAGMKEMIADHNAAFETFEQQLDRNLQSSIQALKKMGHNPDDPYHYFVHEFGHDSHEALAAEVIFHIKLMLHEDLPIIDRLKHAVFLGKASVLIQHYLPQSTVQRGKAKKPRTVEINELVKKLAKEDAPAKELWLRFYGLLDEKLLSPCVSKSENKYTYTSSNGKDKSITFGTFQNKLSEYRKS